MMLWIKAFHIISMVAWFAGIFYLPRLYVYHAMVLDSDSISNERFKLMERRLYKGIMWPAALLTTGLGIWLITYNSSYYLQVPWMHAKLVLVGLIWAYHFTCGYFFRQFDKEKNSRSALFFRIFNEIPTVLLTVIVILVVVKPF